MTTMLSLFWESNINFIVKSKYVCITSTFISKF